MGKVLDNVTDGVLVVDADWRVARANTVVADILGEDDRELVGTNVVEVFPRSATSTFHERFGDNGTPAAVSFEEYFPELETWLAVRTVPTEEGLVIYLRDVTRRKTLQQNLDEREAELTRLSRINGIIQEIIRELIGATARGEIERTVCERLASADLYEYIWIGEHDAASDRLTHRIAAGEYDGVVDFGREEESGETDSPEKVAVRTGETQVIRQLVENDSVPDRIQREAFAHGLQSSIAVPIQYGTATYGVLGVYATHPDAFSDRERESLKTLGVTAGFVINAARQRNLLLSDTVIELAFSVTDPDVSFVSAASKFDCELTVEGIVPVDEQALICFVTVERAQPRALLELFEEATGVEAGRVVHEATADGETGGILEIILFEKSPLLVLVEHGATVRVAEFDAETGRIVAEVAPDADVREIVEAVGSAHPGTELLSKRERQRSVKTAQEFRSSLHERLTDRQRTALRTAFHGGYYSSPRDSTAEELAGTLGISSPTFHDHLRAGEWKLLDAFFEHDSEYERLRETENGSKSEENPDDG